MALTRTSLPLQLAQIVTWALLSYWALIAVIFPVMMWDAHTYNLARVEIALLGGLFENPYWLGERQIAFPWSFDALHLPFVKLGWGCGIPSFLCLVGTLLVARHLMTRYFGKIASIWTLLALVSMPTLVYQGVSSKNDIPVLFGMACWLLFMDRWHEVGRRRWLVLMAFALGFGAGAKSSGLPIGLLLGLISLVLMRRHPRVALEFCGWSLLALVLLGSVETYINNWQFYGEWLGPDWFVTAHSNTDSLRGALANAVRYIGGNLNFGLELFRPHPPSYEWLEQGVQNLLNRVGLGTAGMHASHHQLQFLKNGGEAGSDFGLTGTVTLFTVAGALLSFQFRQRWYWLAFSAAAFLVLVSFTTAWMPWNARFLLIPFALGGALVGVLAQAAGRQPWTGWLLLAIFTLSGVTAVTESTYRHPRMILTSIHDRDRALTAERQGMLEIVTSLRQRANELSDGLWLNAGSDSWVFAVMNRRPFPVIPLPRLDRLAELNRPDIKYLLILDKPLPDFDSSRFEVIERYRNSQSFLILLRPPTSP